MVVVWSCIVVDTQGRVGLKVASTAGLNVGLYGFSVVLLVVGGCWVVVGGRAE